tara:strand:+ start:384 stop:677 length:294 start_codon:yes stop_codon:yes gene_type:complete
MALNKTVLEDKIEIVGAYKSVQIRTATVIDEDGAELSRSFHRHALTCVSSSQAEGGTWTHTDTDVSGESAEVQGIATAVWTEEVKAALRAANEDNAI